MSIEVGVFEEKSYLKRVRASGGKPPRYLEWLRKMNDGSSGGRASEPSWERPRLVVDSLTFELAETLVLGHSVGLMGEFLGNERELEEVRAEVLLGDRIALHFNLVLFLQTEVIAVPSVDSNGPPKEDGDIASLEAMVRDLETVTKQEHNRVFRPASKKARAVGFLHWLLGAGLWCLGRRRALYSIVVVDKWDGETVITDRRIGEFGFNRFKKASVDDCDHLLVKFMSGAVYRIPCQYLAEICGGQETSTVKRQCSIEQVRIVRGREEIQVTLCGGEVLRLPWDTILMACEPLYEHFGGLTESARRLTEKWSRKRRPFRIVPPLVFE